MTAYFPSVSFTLEFQKAPHCILSFHSLSVRIALIISAHFILRWRFYSHGVLFWLQAASAILTILSEPNANHCPSSSKNHALSRLFTSDSHQPWCPPWRWPTLGADTPQGLGSHLRHPLLFHSPHQLHHRKMRSYQVLSTHKNEREPVTGRMEPSLSRWEIDALQNESDAMHRLVYYVGDHTGPA